MVRWGTSAWSVLPHPERRCAVMGILNVTPDSFYDGGRHAELGQAIKHGEALAVEGADVIDIGGESTRPGSAPVDPDDELARVLQVVEGLVDVVDVPLSVDTRHASVAAACLAAGARIINDVTAGSDPDMFATVADAGAGLVLMHMRGEPGTMQDAPEYDDVVSDVAEFLVERVDQAVAAGVDLDAIAVDPGLGFGKTMEHNLAILRNLRAIRARDRALLVGHSRKSMLGTITGRSEDARLPASLAVAAMACAEGAHILRVHDVGATVDVAKVVAALRGGR